MEKIEQMERVVVRVKKMERLEIVEMEGVMERLRKMENVMAILRHTLHQMQVLTISLKTIQMQQKESPKEVENIPTTQIQLGRGLSTTNAGPDPHQDAIILYSAFKGNLAQVIDILANRNERQRKLIRQEYKSMYSEELISRFCQELDRDVSGSLGAKMNPTLKKSLKDAIVLWMLDAARRDATIVGQALTSWTIDLKAITEVICSRTPSELQKFKLAYFEIYHKKHGTVLDNDISSKTGGDHRRLLLACLNTARDEGMIVDAKQAEADAVRLYKDGEARWGTEEKTFIRIFTERNRAHLVAVASCYKRLYGNTLAKAVKNETSGNFMYGLLTLLRCAENPPKYFAKVLHKAITGSGASDAAALTRVVVTRAEIDMIYIKEEYMKKYKTSLRDAIQSATTGDHRAFLLYLVGTDDMVELQQLIAMEES